MAMNTFGHDNPGQSLFQGSDLACIQVNNDFQDDEEDHLEKERLQEELNKELDEMFNRSGANMSVISSSRCSDDSDDDLESNTSHKKSIHKPNRKKTLLESNPAYGHLRHNVNKNFQPDFHKDGSFPSPIPQYNPQVKDKPVNSTEVAHNVSKQYVYEGISGTKNHETLHALNEMRRIEIARLEKDLSEYKMQAEMEIDSLRKKLLITESESQRVILQYQHQCENLKERAQNLEQENSSWKQKVEVAEKSNSKLVKEVEKMRLNIVNLEEQLTILNRNNGGKQFDTSFDVVINDLKKKHAHEVDYLQEQYKTILEQMKAKDHHCSILANELKQLQQVHHQTISENNRLIGNLTKDLSETQMQNDRLCRSNSYEEVAQLNSQLIECAKQNQQLNSTLKKLTVENEKLRADLSASLVVDKHAGSGDASRLEEDYQNNLRVLQKQRDEVKKLTELLTAKDKNIAEMEKKQFTYQHCMEKMQKELEKHAREKNLSGGVHSNHDCENLRSTLEMQLEDTMCKLIRAEENMSAMTKQMKSGDKLMSNSDVDEYMHYHQTSLENLSKQKDEENKKLQNRMEEYVKEIDELKQMYVKVCSEKENCLNEKEKIERRLDELNCQFTTLDKQYELVVKEKEEMAIALIGAKKELNQSQDSSQKRMLEKEIEELKNELKMQNCQKEMIAQFKIDLAQSKERVLATEQRLQAECNSKVASYKEQLESLKKHYDERLEELKLAKETISKFTDSDLQSSAKVVEDENMIKSKLSDYEHLIANVERKHKLSTNEMVYKYKNELYELEMRYDQKLNEEKIMYAKKIEELKSKHAAELNSLSVAAKQNATEYASRELIQIVAEHKKQFERAKELLASKTKNINDLELKLEEAENIIAMKSNELRRLKEMHGNTDEANSLRAQIEEERTKFANIMTNWAQEMREMKDHLAVTVAESEKLRNKYAKVKQAALGYKHANLKQQHVYNELLANCVRFLDQLKVKTDQLLTQRETEIQAALNDFENECKQRRTVFSSDSNKLSFNVS
ncbi:putative leucine-rich repeat-containing protein DDB_G0290503 [Adelges cooleyi]|uniref:putative leucine-rich repeat-containing protein DDB_G0290503 n=1 Tax=Adelges cooleyi TaxID=133065 RepID=UPI00217FA7EE|nr:putative leucine-rich repeat-containing protein DDB_G0290503 [Adelges cooleyi]